MDEPTSKYLDNKILKFSEGLQKIMAVHDSDISRGISLLNFYRETFIEIWEDGAKIRNKINQN